MALSSGSEVLACLVFYSHSRSSPTCLAAQTGAVPKVSLGQVIDALFQNLEKSEKLRKFLRSVIRS